MHIQPMWLYQGGLKKKYKLKLSTVNFEEDNSFLPFENNLIHNINMSVTFVS